MFTFENRKQERAIKAQIAQKQQLYQRVFNTEDGKLVLEDLEKRCFIKHTTFDENHGKMSLNEGRRSIYVYIKDLISKDLTQILEELSNGTT